MLAVVALAVLASSFGPKGPGDSDSRLEVGFPQVRHPGKLLGNYLDTSFTGQLAVDACSQFAAEFTSPSFCLRGDGTSTGSLTLSAVGSPTTQTMPWCENGLNCGNVSRQVVSASNYYTTAAIASPTGSWWGCSRQIIDAPLPANADPMGQDDLATHRSWYLRVTSSGQVTLNLPGYSGATVVQSASGLVVGGASQVICGWYHFVGAGNVNTATVYVDGVQVAQNTTEPPPTATTQPVFIWQHSNLPVSRGGFAMFGTGDPSSTLFARLAAATAPTPQGTRGEAVSTTRASASWVSASDGSLTVLQPNRLGVSGGVVSSPSRTNVHLDSEQLGAAAWAVANVTVTSDVTTAPDGSKTADLVVPTAASIAHEINQGHPVTSGTTYTESRFLKMSGWRYVQFLGNATDFGDWYTNFDLQTCTVSQSNAGTGTAAVVVVTPAANGFCRVAVSHAAIATDATASARITLDFVTSPTSARFPSVAGDGTSGVYDWGEQFETGSIASAYCRSEGTSSTCAGDQVTVPTPSGLSTKEGCAAFSIVPTWTGANPAVSSMFVLNSNAAGTAREGYVPTGQNTMGAFDGTHTATVTASFTAGTKIRFATRWSASANQLEVDNLTTGTKGTATAFSGFPSFDATTQIGGLTTGNQPLGSVISDIQFGASAGACQ